MEAKLIGTLGSAKKMLRYFKGWTLVGQLSRSVASIDQNIILPRTLDVRISWPLNMTSILNPRSLKSFSDLARRPCSSWSTSRSLSLPFFLFSLVIGWKTPISWKHFSGTLTAPFCSIWRIYHLKIFWVRRKKTVVGDTRTRLFVTLLLSKRAFDSC